jgi:hypothetical protein
MAFGSGLSHLSSEPDIPLQPLSLSLCVCMWCVCVCVKLGLIPLNQELIKLLPRAFLGYSLVDLTNENPGGFKSDLS